MIHWYKLILPITLPRHSCGLSLVSKRPAALLIPERMVGARRAPFSARGQVHTEAELRLGRGRYGNGRLQFAAIEVSHQGAGQHALQRYSVAALQGRRPANYRLDGAARRSSGSVPAAGAQRPLPGVSAKGSHSKCTPDIIERVPPARLHEIASLAR